MAKKEGLTPMMKQFFDLKEKHPDAILLFRCGDFYETYADDAVQASQILGITLTRRNNGKEFMVNTEMAGFPYHALDTYLPKLIRAGRRVAICDQLEDPKMTKKLVKRGITELVTPGVAMNDNVLSTKENNFLAALHFGKGACGMALLDISTGEFMVAQGTADYVDKLMGNFNPKEVIYEHGKKAQFEACFGTRYITKELDDWCFADATALQKITHHFQVKNLKGFGIDHLKSAVVAAGVILQYLEMTLHTQLKHITGISRIEEERYVRLDKFTLRSLELVSSMNDEGVSLLDIIDRTLTPMGARMLRRWVSFPLKDVRAIQKRQDVVDCFFRHPELRNIVDEHLQEIGDLERITAKVSAARVTPRDVQQLRIALQALLPIKNCLMASEDDTLRALGEKIELCEEMRERIARELQPNPPLLVAKGGVIANGVCEQLDELRQIAYSGKDYLLQIQQREAEKTGISSLKIGYNNVFGYYLEVRNTYKEQVPQEWIRKQTLTQAERYITQELKDYEEKILGAEEKILALESRLFNELVAALAQHTAQMQQDAVLVAQLDCLLSFAKSAAELRYIRPVVDESEVLDIKQGRHPVIEQQMPVGEKYIPNDVYLDTQSQQVVIITGPNMAGKSALLRQTALIVLLAQIGSFVPAASARVGVVDKIFTRVGASDNISMGESTFMVEMNEAASILNNISQRSLILFDELGRGTSTYDGISIAWSIVEYIHENQRGHARTLFATHYHELNEMEKTYSRVKNYNVSVKEVDGKVIFLRRLVEGGSAHSFGIHVARLAGMPMSIVKRAERVLEQMEASRNKDGVGGSISIGAGQGDGVQMNFFQLDDPILTQVRDEILHLDVNNLTPLEALNKLSEIKKIVGGK
ncbi:MAG: DNA mismatch repair protein MutS [Bacteroidales bacterium]|nr:DNA mismatch repair protein MutS [Candidatus Physcousia equi]